MKKALLFIQSRGYKITKVRKAIVKIIFDYKKPLSVPDIQKLLIKRGSRVNKTTVYREIYFLLKHGLITEINLSSNIKYYESAYLNHHHHLICDACGKVEEINCPEIKKPMEEFEKAVLKKGFEINKHSLEFYGNCVRCK